jgi:hypothetical protein
LTPNAVAERLLKTATVVALVAAFVQGVVHLSNLALGDLELTVLDAGSDTGAFAWASTAATFAAAFAALVLAAAATRWVRTLATLAVMLAFLSLDDFVQIHERVSEEALEIGFPEAWHVGRLFWVVVLLPVLAATFMLLWRIAHVAPPDERRVLRVGLGLLVFAVALEAASPLLFHFDWDHLSWPYEVEVAVEEGAELAGWIAITGALAARAVRAVGALPRS